MEQLRLYIRNILAEGYEDVGIDYVKTKLPKLSDVVPDVRKVLKDFTLVNIKSDDDIIQGEIKAYDNTDGTEVGNATYGHDYKGGVLKGAVDVRPDMRRRGVGTEMYKFIEEITGETIYPEPRHSESAESFWQQSNRPFGPKES